MNYKEFRQIFRSLRRQPQFTIPAVLALALGIGANAVIFTLINRILLQPLPFPEPQQLATIYSSFPSKGIPRSPLGMADFLDIKNNSTQFQSLAAYHVSRMNLAPVTPDDAAQPVMCARTTADLFNILDAHPLIGRLFQPGDDTPGKAGVTVLSERFWRSKYNGNPDVLGKIANINGQPFTIIGVAENSFHFPRADIDAWTSLALDRGTQRTPVFLRGLGRLRPQTSMEQAGSELQAIAKNVERTYPQEYSNLNYKMIPLTEDVVGKIRSTLWILQAVVGVILLIAILNVANLSFARGLSKEREIAVQTCLGAKRRHVMRLLLLESLVLAACGSILGLFLAWESIRYLRFLHPANLPRLQEVSVDFNVALLSMALAVLAAIGSGVLPALKVSRPNLTETLKSGGRAGTDVRKNLRLRNALVIGEIAMCFTLLIGGGLMARSFLKLSRVEIGFQANPENLLMLKTYPSGPTYTSERRVQFYRQLLEDIRRLPGVEASAISFNLPPNRVEYSNGFEIEGRSNLKRQDSPDVPVPLVSSDYFSTMQIPLLQGRSFQESDTLTSPPVVVVSQKFARTYFGNQGAVGKRIREADPTTKDGSRPWMEIVGVVGDVRYRGANNAFEPVYYRSSNQLVFPFENYVLVRAKDPLGLSNAIVSRVHSEDRSIVVSVPVTMQSQMEDALQQPRFNALLMGIFAVVALILTAIGTYGVMAYSVTQRTQEIGIRMALGAQRSAVLKQILGNGLALALIGSCIGFAGALLLGKFVQAFLFNVSSVDPMTYGLVLLLLLVVAALASYMPARRATTVDPMAALREN
jgi:putative ABC transport system permease protein